MEDCASASPMLGEHIYMIAGDDSDGDCHVIFTQSPVRAIGHFKQMSHTFPTCAETRASNSCVL